MLNNINKYFHIFLFLFFHLELNSFAFAQENQSYFKFPVVNDGVYKLTRQQASSIGFSNIDEVAVFGYPGMLPQRLDSLDLELREVPTQKIGEDLFFFLTGPHQVNFEGDEISYQKNHYSDTLYYLVGKKIKGNQVKTSNTVGNGQELDEFYSVQKFNWDQINILSSGRSWYSNPFFNGERFSFSFNLEEGITGNPQIITQIMGQSLSDSRFEFFQNGSKLGEIDIPAIPNTTYGIKGRESVFRSSLLSNRGNQNIQVSNRSSDFNGAGHLAYSLIISPYSPQSSPLGVYYVTKTGVFRKRSTFKSWLVNDFYNIFDIEESAEVKNGAMVILFDPVTASPISKLAPADLSARSKQDKLNLIIISSTSLLSQANRLAQHKNDIGINAKVFSIQEIFDAFGYGTKDVTAFRNFLAYQYLHNGSLQNVLFFGKGTFDYKNKLGGRPNLTPTYTSRNSLNPLTTYSSDDYFGFLEVGQGEWVEDNSGDELLKIGVGRIPAINFREAREAVDKIINYETRQNMEGSWKRNIAFFADDGDNNIHLNDAESHASFIRTNHPEFSVQKLYLDRFEQTINGNIQSSEETRVALSETLKDGVLLLNFIGHGNETTLTAERVFTVSDLQNFPENNLLPLFVTATCEFGRHDSPFIRSGAEELLFAEKKGAIGLLTTGRPVFSSVNFALNKAFIENVFQTENGQYADLGTIFRKTKNNSLNGPFNRNFSLIGDPSLKLAIPDLKSDSHQFLDIGLDQTIDTLKAMQEVRLTGEIKDPLTGAMITDFQGDFELTIYDSPVTFNTLGDESSPIEFIEQSNILYQGKGKVINGIFSTDAFIPKQISSTIGEGTVRTYAISEGRILEAFGAKNILIGGQSTNDNNDTEGPLINLKFGPELLESAPIIASPVYPINIILEDESGIQVSSIPERRNITLQVNDQTPITLNQMFFAIDGGFKKGKIETELQGLIEGINTITIQAWDNVGNNSIKTVQLEVKGSLDLRILEFQTFPNPANEKSVFNVMHNRPRENLFVEIEVYSLLGNKIFSLSKRYVQAEQNLRDLEWNFFHNKTKYPVKGTYIYKLKLQSEKDGSSDVKSGKIIIQ
ncbi:type IX secretion system sortase PorU [Fontibacter flavus]|uniref:Type IX secretion system sortase PorU n=1 Tax=Fontibacter flavus TaxID=654838 RepID=A0ABV6FY68_9BACT